MKLKLTLLTAAIFTSLLTFSQDFSALYTKLSPSVVTIMVKEQNLETDRSSMTKKMVTSEGLGSGVMVSETDIWTAAHVIATAEELNVHFQSGEVIPAKVITSNAAVDVALIRLLWKPTKAFSIAKIGNSNEVKIGEQTLVIGAPYGLERSLSVGYVSGRISDNSENDSFDKTEYFQTDAAINHGNSGGPMFNSKGELIGLVSSILSQSGGFDGIGFVVTSEVAKHHLQGDQPFWYGATFKVIGGELRSIFNLPQEMGLLVQKVASGSPADISGLRPGIYHTNIEGMTILTGGDIIIKVKDIVISPQMNLQEIDNYLISLKPNQTFSVTVLRNGIEVELTGIVPAK